MLLRCQVGLRQTNWTRLGVCGELVSIYGAHEDWTCDESDAMSYGQLSDLAVPRCDKAPAALTGMAAGAGLACCVMICYGVDGPEMPALSLNIGHR